jgi:DNA-binding GntR family transcriptional regulator
MNKVTTVPLYVEQVYEMLKKSIVDGKYAPGERLRESDLAESMGVSRSPIREAIQRLGKEGLVEIVPRKGVFVTKLTLEMVKELFELREVLEIKSAELAANRIRDDELNQMFLLLEETYNDIRKIQYLQYPWNLDFHKQIACCTRNRYLEEKIYDINVHLLLIKHKSSSEIGRAEKALSEHMKIFEALKKRDPNLASQLMKEHIGIARENAISILSA